MRRWTFALIVTAFGCGAAAQSRTVPTHVHIEASGGSSTQSAWIGAAPVQSRILVGSDGQTYIGIWVDAPNEPTVAHRAPLDLALVIDTSGSMSGEKIVNARLAASGLIENLADGDIVSIYSFSNDVNEIAPPTVIGGSTRSELMQSVRNIQPMGGTNLYDGLRVGESRVSQAPATHPVRRVVVISDGIANIGPSSAQELGLIAGQGTESGVQVSAIGVGLDYDESTLGALAMRSSGRLYHLQNPGEMASILREELQRLSNTVATDAYIEVAPAPGIELLGAEAVPSETVQGATRIRLGSLTGGQHREVLIRARVNTASAGDRPIGSARLVFRDPTGPRAEHTQQVPLRYSVTGTSTDAQHSVDARVQAMVASNEANQAQLRAVQLLNQGQNAAAGQVLQTAQRNLDVAVAAAPPSAARDRYRLQSEHIQQSADSANRATSAGAARPAALQINASAYSDMGL